MVDITERVAGKEGKKDEGEEREDWGGVAEGEEGRGVGERSQGKR